MAPGAPPDAYAALRARAEHVVVVLRAFGFAAPEERAPDASPRRTDHRSRP